MWAPSNTAEHDRRAGLLERARRLIRQHGWVQHGLVDSDGRVSLAGAIDIARTDRDPCGWVPGLLTAAIHDLTGCAMPYPTWHAQRGRTVDEVLQLLDRAVQLLGDELEKVLVFQDEQKLQAAARRATATAGRR